MRSAFTAFMALSGCTAGFFWNRGGSGGANSGALSGGSQDTSARPAQPGADVAVLQATSGVSGPPSGALAPRSLDDWRLANVILVSSVDGSLQARDRSTGLVLWTIDAEPLIEVRQSLGDWRDDAVWIAEPSEDGGILYFDPATGIERIPTSVKTLVEKAPFALLDTVIYTGSKHTTLYTLDVATGKVLDVYGRGGSPLVSEVTHNTGFTGSGNTTPAYVEASPSAASSSDVEAGTIVIGRTDYTLDIHEKKTARAWTIKLGFWGSNTGDMDLISQYRGPRDGLLVTQFQNTTIMAISKGYRPQRWVGQAHSIAVRIFDVFRPTASSRADPSTPLIVIQQPPLNLPEGPSAPSRDLYIDVTPAGDLFALSGANYSALVTSSKSAPWCLASRGQRRYTSPAELSSLLVGVHPEWCQQSPLHTDSPSSQQFSQLPGSDGYFGPDRPRLPPPPFSWWGLFARVAENLLVIVLIAIAFAFMVRQGWIPGIVETIDKLIGQRGRVTAVDISHLRAKLESVDVEQKQIEAPGPDTTKLESEEVARTRSLSDESSDTDVDSPSAKESTQTSVSDISRTPSSVSLAHYDRTPGSGKVSVSFSESSADDKNAKRRKRGSRGGRKVREAKEREKPKDEETQEHIVPPRPMAPQQDFTPAPISVTDDILGYGSHGTVVLRGSFENREVAVKRMLLNFYDVAAQEVNIMQESDDHPNVVRYYCKHQTDQFLFIALELCPGTLEDVIHGVKASVRLPLTAPLMPGKLDLGFLRSRIDPLDSLKQITAGLHHLHSLKIVHRDIKPQNILVANPKIIHIRTPGGSRTDYGPVRLLISDFGLCKKLENEQSSFQATAASVAGTSGWTAPEISMGARYSLKEGAEHTQSSSDVVVPEVYAHSRRLTRAVDIFSLGCVFYYVLSPGAHPFGENFARQLNIENNAFDLSLLKLHPNGVEAEHLISRMISFDPSARPDTTAILRHPLFWTDQEKLDFLVKISDRLEHDTREEHSDLLTELQKAAPTVVGDDWHTRFPAAFVESLGKYRKYHGDRIIDLLRALRNKLHHYNDFTPKMKDMVGSVPSGYLEFFTSKFPSLLLETYLFAAKELPDDEAFQAYFAKAV